MFGPGVLDRTRAGVCAVGYLTVPMAEYLKDPSRPFFKVVGTGFLVRDTTVATNRHVIEGVHKLQRDNGFPDSQKALSFVYPTGVGQLQGALSTMGFVSAPQPPGPDIGFVEFQRPTNPEFQQCKPLPVGSISYIAAGQETAVMGYPYGTSMLTKEEKVYRFGPVIQHGHISAISPFDRVGLVTEILLDLRAAPGMSGSPVVWPGGGQVIGIVTEMLEATVAMALPLDSTSLTQFLQAHDAALASVPRAPSLPSPSSAPPTPPPSPADH